MAIAADKMPGSKHTATGMPSLKVTPVSPAYKTDIPIQCDYVVTMEYIVKRYLDDMLHLLNQEILLTRGAAAAHCDYVQRFIQRHARMRLVCDYLTYSKAQALWAKLREESDDFVPFITAISSEFRLIYPGEKFNQICTEVAESFTLNEGEASVIAHEDSIYNNLLGSKTSRYRILHDNPWLLTIVLISMIRPL